MKIDVYLPKEKPTAFLTEDELEFGKIYLSDKKGSFGFFFVKLEYRYLFPKLIAFYKNGFVEASTSHKRDFYLAPQGSRIIIEN